MSNSPESISVTAQDEYWMRYAQTLAAQAAAIGEIPVGAVIVRQGQILGEGFNCPITSTDPTAHAEIVALRQAAKNALNYRLVDTTLYVTLEPCNMCAGALVHARVGRLVFGALEPKAGCIQSRATLLSADYLNHRVESLGGVCASECAQQLQDFFKMRRQQKRDAKKQLDASSCDSNALGGQNMNADQ